MCSGTQVARFGRPEQLAAYAGTVPRVHESGGRRHYGRMRSDVNQYLQWARTELLLPAGPPQSR